MEWCGIRVVCIERSSTWHAAATTAQAMATPPDVDPAPASPEGSSHSTENSYIARADQRRVPTSTLWHRAHGVRSMKQKAAGQQYLTPQYITPQEEKALVSYLLRM
jgi:hypothetical protein